MKKKRKIFKIVVTTIIIALIAIGMYYIIKMYNNIEIVDNYTAERTKLSTDDEQNVENISEKSKSTADMIEKVTKSVCGISKLSNVGGSILSTATETELGIGTGIVASSDGYILSNSHVTGEKFGT